MGSNDLSHEDKRKLPTQDRTTNLSMSGETEVASVCDSLAQGNRHIAGLEIAIEFFLEVLWCCEFES